MEQKITGYNNVYKTWQGECVSETYQPAPTVFVVPTMTLYADCHVSYTNRWAQRGTLYKLGYSDFEKQKRNINPYKQTKWAKLKSILNQGAHSRTL